MNRTKMSYNSAVFTVAQWIHEHGGQAPQWRDWRAETGLPHRVTMQYVCGGVRHVVSAALGMLSGVSMLVSCHSTVRQSQQCLRCDACIPWNRQRRLCNKCHAAIRQEDAGAIDAAEIAPMISHDLALYDEEM